MTISMNDYMDYAETNEKIKKELLKIIKQRYNLESNELFFEINKHGFARCIFFVKGAKKPYYIAYEIEKILKGEYND